MNKLVNYSSSSSDDENEPAPKKQKTIKLPMPFKKSFECSELDNPYDHQGRKRQIPHIEGNWSSHIFIDCTTLKITEGLRQFFEEVKAKFCEINFIKTPHLSLSKTFILKYHWIENFCTALKQIKFHSFLLQFTPIDVIFLSNEDKSRYFACLLANESAYAHLETLIKHINKTLKEFELEPYYDENVRIYHTSFLWKLTEFSEEEKKFIIENLSNYNNDDIFDTIVQNFTFKTGNKIKLFYYS